MSVLASQLFRFAGLAVIGKIVPTTAMLRALMRDLKQGLVALMMLSILSSTLLLLAHWGLYQFMLMQGTPQNVAIACMVAILALTTLMCGIIAHRCLSGNARKRPYLGLLREASAENADSLIEQCLEAFLAGVLSTEQPSTKAKAKAKATKTKAVDPSVAAAAVRSPQMPAANVKLDKQPDGDIYYKKVG